MIKHGFGNGVKCLKCGQIVAAVWADDYWRASEGLGTCDACLAKESAPEPEVAEPPPPPEELKEQ